VWPKKGSHLVELLKLVIVHKLRRPLVMHVRHRTPRPYTAGSRALSTDQRPGGPGRGVLLLGEGGRSADGG